MDAIELVEQMRRMEKNAGRKYRIFLDSPEDVVAEVEEWAKKNPVKTRQSVFLEQYPNCMMDGDGTVGMCPRNVDKMYVCNLSRSGECTDCRREFGMREVE